MDFTTDKKVYDIPDQYMFGPSLMVCPVAEYKARARQVYFPKSHGWYDVYSGQYIEGGQTLTVNAPYERMPLFARAGSIVPLGPEIEYTMQKQADPLTIVVYIGADASFNLYEDEGTNYNYEQGKYAIIPMSWNEQDQMLTVGNRTGGFEGMLKNRTFKFVFVSGENPVELPLNEIKAKEYTYSGVELSIPYLSHN